MKKLYVIGALASLCLSTSVSAQSSAQKEDAPSKIMLQEFRSTANYNQFDANNDRDIVIAYSNDLSDESTFTLDTDGQGQWDYLTESSADVDQYVGVMGSASAANGFCEFNGIQWLINSDDVAPQDATVTCNAEFSCVGMSEVVVSFTQLYRAFNYDETYIDVSTNAGDDWQPVLINDLVVGNSAAIFGEKSVNISDYAAGEPSVMIRFRWHSNLLETTPEAPQSDVNSYGSGYAWSIDDIMVSSPIENDLVIGETYLNNYFVTQEQDEIDEIDLLNNVTSNTEPFHSAAPFNFAAPVTNNGLLEQTNVIISVTFTDPDGGEEVLSSAAGVTLAPGETDTLWIENSTPAAWMNPIPGLYTSDFVASSDATDELPLNNTGVSRGIRISGESDVDLGASMIMQNNSNTLESQNPDNATQATRYTFPTHDDDRIITHIEFALDDLSTDGEIVFLNIRKGSVLEAEGPDNQMEIVYSYDSGDPQACEYIIDAADLSNTSTPNWISYELPFPLLIEADQIYQAELQIPSVGVPYCYLAGSSVRTGFVSVLYDPNDLSGGDQGWWYYGTSSFCIRLRTELGDNVEEVTIENGMKLVQNFPNPFTTDTRFEYSIDESSQASLEVYDLNGKLVFQDDLGMVVGKTANSYVLNRNGLAAGAYTYSIVTANERITRKMIIE